jgi:hypothetical protein
MYYPTKVGTERVYEEGGKTTVLVVTGVKSRDGAKIVSVGQRVGGAVTPFETMAVSPRGLTRLEIMGRPLDPTLVLLKLPHRPDRQWGAAASYPGISSKGMITARGPEKIKVPAGQFNAIRLEDEYSINGGPLRKVTTWYAPGVGMVMKVSTAGGRESLTVLKSFTTSD